MKIKRTQALVKLKMDGDVYDKMSAVATLAGTDIETAVNVLLANHVVREKTKNKKSNKKTKKGNK